MNRNIARGALRNVKGRANSAIGGVTGDLGRQAHGLMDQVAGGARYVYGRASDRAEGLVADASDFIEENVDRGRAGARALARRVERHPTWTVVGMAACAFVVGRYLRGSPARS